MDRTLTFPKFEDIKVSTKTYTSISNIEINIDKLFECIQTTPYVVHPKKRGRKKKGVVCDLNQDVSYGSIVTVKYEGRLKGVELKPKSPKAREKNSWFRNSITVVMILDKPINFKVCRNGTFQMTGCKNWEHAQMCIKQIWMFIKDHPEVYKYTRDEGALHTMIIPSMRNIDFDLGFNVDREKLSRYMNSLENVYCLMETSFGYTGVNIKIPLDETRNTMKTLSLSFVNGEWITQWKTYADYLELLNEKTRSSKNSEMRYNTFLVFHSGRVIFSGLTFHLMKNTYYRFTKIIQDAFHIIEERLIETKK